MQVKGQNQTKDRSHETEPAGEASIISLKGRGTKAPKAINTFCYLNRMCWWLLGAFMKLRKATVSFVMSVCPSVSSRMEQLSSHWKDFHEI
jgi:hypothetical protein